MRHAASGSIAYMGDASGGGTNGPSLDGPGKQGYSFHLIAGVTQW